MEDGFGRAVSRILSAPLRMERIICLGSRYPESVRFRGTGAGRSGIPYLALHPMGFSVPRRLRFARWSLTPPFHPYRHSCEHRRYNFLWHCPSAGLSTGRPRVSQSNGLGLRGIAPCGVRTFLPGLAPGAILRPSKTKVKLPEIEKYSSRESSRVRICRRRGDESFGAALPTSCPTTKLGHYQSAHPCNALPWIQGMLNLFVARGWLAIIETRS
jgi:hypothetical protein